MSNLVIRNIQIGQSITPSRNFVLTTPASQDGSIKLSTGNLDNIVKDVLQVQTNGNVWINGAVLESSVIMSGNTIDLSAAAVFSKTVTAATTFSLSNVPASGRLASFVLDLTNGGSFVVTWWAGIKWAGGVAPTLTANGRDVLAFMTYDGGATWTGLFLGKDMK